MRSLLAAALLFFAAPALHAQTPDASPAEPFIEAGLEALATGDRPAALAAFTRATEADQDNAEARYQLASILFADGPLQDLGRARQEVRRAVDLDPTNVAYMTAELETLKGEGWNFWIDFARATRRATLANRILSIDSLNAFAHEELATAAIRDYYQYRNAIWTRDLSFYSPSYVTEDPIGTDLTAEIAATGAAGVEQDILEGQPTTRPATPLTDNTIQGTNEIATQGNRFDIDAIAAYGGISFEERADTALELATYHLEIAMEQDPRRRGLYDDVMRLAALSEDWSSTLGALRQMFVHFPDDPAMWRFVGLANHRLGEWEAADAAFSNALERMSEREREVFNDLELILSPQERDAYREDPETYSARFWSARDPRFLNPYNERRLEHYARLTTADLLYSSDDLDLPGWSTERGEVFVRYGVPTRELIIEGEFGAVLEQFADRDASLAIPEAFASFNRFNVWDYGDLQFVFEDPNRNGEFVLYSPPADVFGLPSAGAVQDMDFVLRTREAFRETPERYTFEVPGRQVEIPARVTAFRGDGGRADVYVHFGVPLAQGAGANGQAVDANIQTGAFLVGEGNQLLSERRKTVYGLRAAQIVGYDAVSLWIGTESLDARPGAYDVAVEFETADGAAAGVQRERIEIPDFDSPDLQLSDLLLAIQVEEGVQAGPGRLQRGDFAIQPSPWGVYDVGDPVAVYFEVYNLNLDSGLASYEIEARLVPKDQSRGIGRLFKRIFGGRERGVATEFPVEVSTSDDRQYVLLDASGQEPGFYTLTLRVRDTATGDRAEREVDLLLE
ncbi:MAG: GWxTD domain-containing protein [Bacteroidota bacterium]